MSTIRHHPSHATILDYATGSAPRGRALVLAAHFTRCPDCRAELAACEAVGGALLAELPAATMRADALETALAALDLPAPTVAYVSDDKPREDWLAGAAPEVLHAYDHNRRWFAPGVWVAHLDQPKGVVEKSYLLGVGPGIAVPFHSHRGIETTCVLKGEFIDRKQRFGVGDFAEVDEETEHRPITSKAGECICLIAADGPLVPLDMMGRLFQPFAGI
jgi:putative transcriptional regulator